MKVNGTYVIVVVFAIFMAFGAYHVYLNDCDSYESSASMNSDGTIAYTLSGPDAEYYYSVFSNTELPEKLLLYFDEDYASELNDHYTQKEFFTVLKSMLERRGMESEFVDAEGLKEAMDHPEYAIFFVSGALPDTVYDGNVNGNSQFVKWLDAGGKVYWAGQEIGRYVSTPDGVIDHKIGFFDGDVLISDNQNQFAHNESEMFQYTQLRYDDCLYGLKADHENSIAIGYVSDEGYSSVSVAKVLNGNVTVFGGKLCTTKMVTQVVTDRTCCADLVICGLTYLSEGLDHGTGTLKSNVSSSTSVVISDSEDVTFLISVGEPASHWSKAIRVDETL